MCCFLKWKILKNDKIVFRVECFFLGFVVLTRARVFDRYPKKKNLSYERLCVPHGSTNTFQTYPNPYSTHLLVSFTGPDTFINVFTEQFSFKLYSYRVRVARDSKNKPSDAVLRDCKCAHVGRFYSRLIIRIQNLNRSSAAVAPRRAISRAIKTKNLEYSACFVG